MLSANKYARNGTIKVKVVSVVGLSGVIVNINLKNHPSARPNRIPPAATKTNW
jgi:hypothetical protein